LRTAFCWCFMVTEREKPLNSERLTMFDPLVWSQFLKEGEVTEVRVLGVQGKNSAWGNEWARGTVSGYFDDHEAFCKAVKLADRAKHGGIYFTVQVIDPRLIGRAFNRLRVVDTTTSDNNVIALRWLLLDTDPIRPSGVSSSDSELKQALAVRDGVAEWMTSEMGFAAPIRAMSGNGGHLLFRLPDMPVGDDSKAFIKTTLQGIATRFDTDTVLIDQTVSNPARIWKLYGTTARKGDPIPAGPHRAARPHRMAYIETLGR